MIDRPDPAVLLDVVRAAGYDRVLVSRAADPGLVAVLATGLAVDEAPTVRGRTVWDAVDPGMAIVESPNWWGRFDIAPNPATWMDRTGGLVVPGATPTAPEWIDAVDTARWFAKALGQVAGVTAAHGRPEAPWFVILQPHPAEEVVRRLDPARMDATVIGPRRPELPGGIRLRPPIGGGRDLLRACVASFRHAIEEAGGS